VDEEFLRTEADNILTFPAVASCHSKQFLCPSAPPWVVTLTGQSCKSTVYERNEQALFHFESYCVLRRVDFGKYLFDFTLSVSSSFWGSYNYFGVS
jgi:hypothetical protein